MRPDCPCGLDEISQADSFDDRSPKLFSSSIPLAFVLIKTQLNNGEATFESRRELSRDIKPSADEELTSPLSLSSETSLEEFYIKY